LAFSPEFSAARSSSCAFKDVLSAAACVAIPDHSRRSSVAGKGSKTTIISYKFKKERQYSCHMSSSCSDSFRFSSSRAKKLLQTFDRSLTTG
jgi:hypothetical protein